MKKEPDRLSYRSGSLVCVRSSREATISSGVRRLFCACSIAADSTDSDPDSGKEDDTADTPAVVPANTPESIQGIVNWDSTW